MASPWVQRMLKEQEVSGIKAAQRAEPTLGDSVPADRQFRLTKGEALWQAIERGDVNPPASGQECAYCGLSEADGDFKFSVVEGFTLDEFCLVDTDLGRCGHSRICDCVAGICQ